MDNIESAADAIKDNETPSYKLQSGCWQCKGFVKNCDHCGMRIEILNGRPLNYHEGSIHRCGRPRS